MLLDSLERTVPHFSHAVPPPGVFPPVSPGGLVFGWEAEVATIEAHISDLFFGMDHSDSFVENEKDGTAAFNLVRLKDEAIWFAQALNCGGGPKVEPDDLVADFLKRN